MGKDMKALNVDIKILITLFAIVAGLGGFYYTTQMRLDRLETAIEEKQGNSEIEGLKQQVRALRKRIKRLENK